MRLKTILSTVALASIFLSSACIADSASGLATGKRQHKPIAITKSIDKSSPLLMEATVSGSKAGAYRLCPDGTMIQPGEKCPEKSAKK